MYTYTGREWDKETGLYYYRARYYDPMEGRFISKDPIGFRGGDVVLYGYVHNNPINRKDPKGLFDWTDALPSPEYFPPPSCDNSEYCNTYSARISMAADAASIYAVVATAVSGGVSSPVTGAVAVTAKVVSIANGVVSISLCGPAPSHVTTAVGAKAPGWWGAAVSAIDAALSVTGN